VQQKLLYEGSNSYKSSTSSSGEVVLNRTNSREVRSLNKLIVSALARPLSKIVSNACSIDQDVSAIAPMVMNSFENLNFTKILTSKNVSTGTDFLIFLKTFFSFEYHNKYNWFIL
jgi:hypothetical protein